MSSRTFDAADRGIRAAWSLKIAHSYSPEIVDDEETAAIEILAQQCRFVVVELPLADLDRIEPWIVEHALVNELISRPPLP